MDLFARHAVNLSSGRLAQSTLTLPLDPLTAWIAVEIDRTGWASGTTLGVAIVVTKDGEDFSAKGQTTVGHRAVEPPTYRLRYGLPSGYMGATDLGTGSGLTSLATAAEVAKVPKSDGTATWNATALASLQAEATDALNAYDPPTKTELDSAVSPLATTTELAKVPKSDGSSTWNATALASLQAEATDALNAYDPPTKAELDSAVSPLATAAALTTVEGKVDTVDTVVDAIKAKTDSLAFTSPGFVDANAMKLNTTTITGNGTSGTPWGPA